MIAGLLTLDMLPDLYNKIAKEIKSLEADKNAIEVIPKEISKKGYDSTGYRYQYLCNVLNQVIGSWHWTLTPDLIHNYQYEVTDKWGNTKTYFNVCVKTTLRIGNWIPSVDTESQVSSVFEILDEKVHYGNNTSPFVGEAIKGCVTNSIKKTFALAGFGERAMTGALAREFGDELPPDEEFETADFEHPVTKPINKSVPTKGIEIYSTSFYDAKNPYGLAHCHRTNFPLSEEQMNFCKKERYRPSSVKVISESKGNINSIKLSPEEIEYAKELKQIS